MREMGDNPYASHSIRPDSLKDVRYKRVHLISLMPALVGRRKVFVSPNLMELLGIQLIDRSDRLHHLLYICLIN